MSQTVVEAVVTALVRHNITEVFGQSLPSAFFLAAERAGIRQVMYRTENAGGAMADGYSRVSGRISVIGAQNGPAATLLVPPMTEAMLASVPMLAIVQDVPSATRDRNAFQEIDHFALFSGCAKWIRQLNDPARAADYVDMAIAAATSGRPGPVVLMLPKDVMIAEAQPAPFARSAQLGQFPLDRPRPDRAAVAEAARLIAEAEHPILIAGGGVQRSQATAAVAALQEMAGLPVATTNMGKGSVDERHPLSMGVVGNVMGKRSTTRFQREILADADVVVLAGNRTNENGTDGWALIPEHAKVIHLDIDGTEIGRTYEALRLAGDVRAGIEDLTEALGSGELLVRRRKVRAALEARILDARTRSQAMLAELVDLDGVPLRPERVMRELDELIDADTVLVADASYSTIWMTNYLTARAPGQQFLSPRGMAGLGWGYPMAIGAKIARPEAEVVCITGDGGFGHVWQELETAVRADVPLTVILLNNSILGFQKHAELVQFSETTSAIEFAEVDHAAIARACGAEGVRVTSVEELQSALKASVGNGKVTLIEVITDSDAFPPVTRWEGRAEVLPPNAA
ncbi:acetolactate synthase catalytic subunit [Leucobacter sp. W1153]|uniref:acetolactate synthase catalytic subunit n=1 Tax=Leucobacter sp. W1153 TaxID=3439064 RepID=UPI003F2FC359